MDRIKKYLPYIKNKYLIALVTLLVVLFFIEDTNVFSLIRLKADLRELRKENAQREQDIELIKKKTKELTSNPEALEKFARETYKMKKKDEIIYLFVTEEELKAEK